LPLTGLEDIIDIAGTVGGGIIMNALYMGIGMYKPLLKVKVIKPAGNILFFLLNDYIIYL
jgi:UDP-N-acetylmuramate dehydrogenase